MSQERGVEAALILDTDAISAIADDDPAVRSILAAANEIAIPVIVIGEYRYGIAQSRHSTGYQNWLDGFAADCNVLDIVEATTQFYASIKLELREAGKPIPINDLWIAALCRQHQLPVLSRDSHFDAVRGIRRVSW